jgi:hypothetical protein
MARGTRPRSKRIEVWLTEEEHQAIEARARNTRMSGSAYLRILGLGYEPKSVFDQEAVMALIRFHADQGRLGGLLKLWLTEKPGEGVPIGNIRSVLQQIESLQMKLARMIMDESIKTR